MIYESLCTECTIVEGRHKPGCPAVRMSRELSPLPDAVVRRLNVDHLTTGLSDHHYVWRVARPGEWGPLLQYGIDGWPAWFRYQRMSTLWLRVSSVAVTALPGERFIRVGQVIPCAQ